MSQSLAKIILHIVFSTKQRKPWLRDETLRNELYAYLATVLRNIQCPAIIINGVEDHLHVLCLLSRMVRVMDLIKEAKTETSKWIKKVRAAQLRSHGKPGMGPFRSVNRTLRKSGHTFRTKLNITAGYRFRTSSASFVVGMVLNATNVTRGIRATPAGLWFVARLGDPGFHPGLA